MATKKQLEPDIKWVHVKNLEFFGFQTVIVWAGETVEQFKHMLELGAETIITVPAAAFPLSDEESLFDRVKDFDTVLIEM